MTVVFTGMSSCLTLVYICVTKSLINHSCKNRKTDTHVKKLIEVTLGYLSAGQSVIQFTGNEQSYNRSVGSSVGSSVGRSVGQLVS